MTSTPTERLVSADSHVAVSHEQVKANLDPGLHDAYDTVEANPRARTRAWM